MADRITVVQGDATSQRDVAVAALGQDAIVSALGQGRSLNPDDLFDRASAAVGEAFEWETAVQKTMYRALLRRVHANKKIADDRIRADGLDWTLVFPAGLNNRPAKVTYRVDDRIKMKGARMISRADVAACMAQPSAPWPPPRTATGGSRADAYRRAVATSSSSAHRAIRAGACRRYDR
ncbi:NAD(P)-dependent oxidoreductase [Streptomyces blattellae]|uniref:NAD(P)-dependent oxidoreductase n=1 Tax=Streptomyces blattellae TaxID=2569855 RepID=UPI001E39DE41|nr:NAD(P)-binding oxidoreductase [Streptomyces blattellae]